MQDLSRRQDVVSTADPCSDRSWKHGVNTRALKCSEWAAQLQPLRGNKALRDKSNTWKRESFVGVERRRFERAEGKSLEERGQTG